MPELEGEVLALECARHADDAFVEGSVSIGDSPELVSDFSRKPGGELVGGAETPRVMMARTGIRIYFLVLIVNRAFSHNEDICQQHDVHYEGVENSRNRHYLICKYEWA